MEDRNVEFPSRYRLEKVAGTDDIYDLTPAPGTIYTAGTYFNKVTFLKDATAALYGFGADAVPDEVLAWLGQYNAYWWARRLPAGTRYVEKRTARTETSATVLRTNGAYAKTISIDPETGEITLVDAIVVTTLAGKDNVMAMGDTLAEYAPCYVQDDTGGGITYLPEGTTSPHSNTGTIFTNDYSTGDDSAAYELASNKSPRSGPTAEDVESILSNVSAGEWEYCHSSDRSAYPDGGVRGGYEWKYLGVPFRNAIDVPKVAAGSYVGSGLYGSADSNSLTFDFPPKALFIQIADDVRRMFWFGAPSNAISTSTNAGTTLTVSVVGDTLTWYSGKNASEQMNSASKTYYYIALG